LLFQAIVIFGAIVVYMGGRSLFDWNGIGAIAFLGGDAIAFWLMWWRFI
jgi:hypothetical protein